MVLHAIAAQWGARLQEFDRIICLGDLVDYGPGPGAVIDWVRAHATNVVRGNHDHAVATGEPCRSATAFLEASVLTRLRLQPTLSLVVNPGSLGQAKDGGPDASYAVWEDGEVVLRKVRYPVERTVAKITNLLLPAVIANALRHLLETGNPPTI